MNLFIEKKKEIKKIVIEINKNNICVKFVVLQRASRCQLI